MPGIVGLVSQRPAHECAEVVDEMIGSLLHEPFYVSGTCHAPELGVYAGWVAHEDSFAAEQSGDDDVQECAVAFAGENHSDQAASIVDRYRTEGEDFIEQLNGVFAGLVIDRARGTALLFNDRYGFDRVYVAEIDDEIYFASEAKAILAVLPRARAFDGDGVADFLAFGCTTEGRTLFRGMSLLPPGSAWSIVHGQVRKRRYFNPTSWETQEPVDAGLLQSAFDEVIAKAAPKYLAGARSALGVSLTAGLDSRVVMAASNERPICYTYDGPRGETLDAQIAKSVAGAADCEHQIIRLRSDFFADFAAHAERTVYLTDGTFGPTGAHELYLSRAARALAPARLTGVFGGEIFRGVSTFGVVGLDAGLLAPTMRSRLRARTDHSPTTGDHPVTAAAFKEIPWSIFGSVAACRSQLSFRTPFLDNDVVAFSYRIPSALRRTMSDVFSAFIQRHAPRLAAIPTDMAMLGSAGELGAVRARAAAKATFKLDYWLNDGMPHWLSAAEPMIERLNAAGLLLGRHKYLRYRRWFRRELGGYVRESLQAASAAGSEFLEPRFIAGLADAHIAGRRNYIQEINAVLTLDSVCRLFFKPERAAARAGLHASVR